MSNADVIAYLAQKQQAERISGMEMAQRLGMSETNWSHARHKRRGLSVKQIERAIEHYPEIRDLIGPPSGREQVPA